MDTADLDRAKSIVDSYNRMEDFTYSGSLPLGRTWGFTIARTRDSCVLEQSNYAVINADMKERFPDDVSEERWGHFAVDWVEHLAVRMLNDHGQVTEAGLAILEWKDRLADHPVANDEDFSEREDAASQEQFEIDLEEISVRDGLPDDWKDQVYGAADAKWTGEGNEYSDDLPGVLELLGFLSLKECTPMAYYDLGLHAFYRYVVEYKSSRCVWFTENTFYGRGFVRETSGQDSVIPGAAIEVSVLPDNVRESLDVYVA